MKLHLVATTKTHYSILQINKGQDLHPCSWKIMQTGEVTIDIDSLGFLSDPQ